jgi:hypothetical protein
MGLDMCLIDAAAMDVRYPFAAASFKLSLHNLDAASMECDSLSHS